jgi:hypothetical protein
MKKFFSILTSLASLCLLLFTLFIVIGCEDPEPDPICEAPTDVQVIAITNSSATLTWTALPNTTVEISIQPQSNPPGPFTSTANTLTIDGLSSGTNYIASLRTLCPDGSTSDPVTVAFRTSNIVIGDIIIQKDAPSDAQGLCTNNPGQIPQDIINQSAPINWEPSSPKELLKIVNGTTVLLIIKDISGSSPVYKVLENKVSLCGATVNNAPVTVNSTVSGFILTGSGYIVNLNATNAEIPSLPGTTTYSMYR